MSRKPNKNRMPVKIRGTLYPSVSDAAQAIGCSPMAIYTALSRGRLDTVGFGMGWRPREKCNGAQGKQITLGGVTFPSMRAASLALGFREAYVAEAMQYGSPAVKARLSMVARRYAERTAQDGQA